MFTFFTVSVPLPVAAICVVSSPLLISANISKLVLVTASTVSVIPDVTLENVSATSVLVYGGPSLPIKKEI